VVLAGSGDLSKAIEHFRTAARLESGFAEAHFHLALGLDRTGNHAEAIVEYINALRARPEFLQARYMLAGACDRAGGLDGAERLLAAVTERAPKFAEARYNFGLLLQRREDSARAVEQLKVAVALEPGNARMQLALGIAIAAQGRADDAIATLK